MTEVFLILNHYDCNSCMCMFFVTDTTNNSLYFIVYYSLYSNSIGHVLLRLKNLVAIIMGCHLSQNTVRSQCLESHQCHRCLESRRCLESHRCLAMS